VSENFEGGLQNITGPLSQNIIYFWNPQLKPSRLAPLLGDLIEREDLGAWS